MAIRPQCSRIAMTFWKQEAYNSDSIPNSAINLLYQPREPVLLELTQDRIDDADTIKGHEFPVSEELDQVVAQDIRVPFTFPADLSVTGLLTAFAMGSHYAVSGISSNYVHTFQLQDACSVDQMPATSWILGLVGATESIQKVTGVIVNELTLTLDNAGQLTISGTAFTDGKMTPEPAFVFPTDPATGAVVVGANGDMFYDDEPGPAVTSIKSVLRGFDFTIRNNLDVADGRSNVVNAGVYLDSLRFGNREYELTVRVEGHIGDGFWTDFIDKTMKTIKVTVTKDAGSYWQLDVARCKIATCTPRFDGIRDVLEMTFKFYYDDTSEGPCVLTISNQDAAYEVLS